MRPSDTGRAAISTAPEETGIGESRADSPDRALDAARGGGAESAAEPDAGGTAPRRTARDRGAQAAEWTWGLTRRIGLGTRKPANWIQLFKFGAVGVSGYFVNLTAFTLLSELADVFYLVAAIAAFCVAVSSNFIWNRLWTFRASEGNAGFQAARFLIVSVAALGINLAILALLVSVADLQALPSQAIAVAIAMPCNFIGNKLWTFA